MIEKGERVSNISRFENAHPNPPVYRKKNDILEGAMILKENSRDGLCPHQHFQENRSVITIIDDLQDSYISVRIASI